MRWVKIFGADTGSKLKADLQIGRLKVIQESMVLLLVTDICAMNVIQCKSALKFDPGSASNSIH